MPNTGDLFYSDQERKSHSNIRKLNKNLERSVGRKDTRAARVSELLESKFREIAYTSHLLNMKRPANNRYQDNYEEEEQVLYDPLKRDQKSISFYKSINQRSTATPGRVSSLKESPKVSMLELSSAKFLFGNIF